MTTSLKSSKKNNLSGEVVIPGDKSISHRAILFGLLSKGKRKFTAHKIAKMFLIRLT